MALSTMASLGPADDAPPSLSAKGDAAGRPPPGGPAKLAAHLEILASVSRVFSEAPLDARGLLSTVCHEVATRLGDACSVALLAEDGETLELAALHETKDGTRGIVEAAFAAGRLTRGAGVLGGVVASGRPVLWPVVDRRELVRAVEPVHRALAERLVLHSFLAVPLRARGRILGSLQVFRVEPGRTYGEDDLALLSEIADRAALALENVRLYEAERRARREAEEASRSREELFARVQEAYDAAKDAERRKDEFLAMLGHELRNPLAPILTALELMKLRAGDQTARERAVIERQVRHMVRLVDDLLDVSRITRGKIELKKERLEIAEVVRKAVEVASPLLEQQNHALELDVPSAGLAVEGDPARLVQVFSNLLTNAARFAEPGGRVRISAGLEGGRVVVRVRDWGIGISSELLPRVFDLFVQAPQSSARSQGGMGLGLAIARRLVEMHGGEIEAESEGRGRGAEFFVRLPAAPRIEGEAEDAAAPEASAAALRVLVVDDNTDAAEMLAEALLAAGHDPVVAHDAPGALSLFARAAPDVALLDIGLPVMDGYELARRLREQPGGEDVRLVAITGYGQEQDIARSREAGFAAHFVKPVTLDAVLAEVEQARPVPRA